jgi:formamidopyrimidine-DNA glycosylase
MPELPDVEVWRRHLKSHIVGDRILKSEVHDLTLVEGSSGAEVERALTGRRIMDVKRRGKYLFLETDGEMNLILHLGMTGAFEYGRKTELPPHTSLVLTYKDRFRLIYICQRKFGLIKIAKDPRATKGVKDLGPDPLEDAIDFDVFHESLTKRRRPLKPLFMDQTFLAGLGNVYADEVLYQAGLRPDREATELSREEAKRLFDAIHKVINVSIEANADPDKMPLDWLTPVRREGEGAACPKCGLTLRRKLFGKRAAFFCSACQK